MFAEEKESEDGGEQDVMQVLGKMVMALLVKYWIYICGGMFFFVSFEGRIVMYKIIYMMMFLSCVALYQVSKLPLVFNPSSHDLTFLLILSSIHERMLDIYTLRSRAYQGKRSVILKLFHETQLDALKHAQSIFNLRVCSQRECLFHRSFQI